MKKWKLLAFPLVALSLTACGEDLANAMDIDDYRSDIFAENMYSVWPDELLQIEETRTFTIMDETIKTGVSSLDVEDSGAYASDPFGSDFAEANKLSATDSAVSYGFTSKLFDGILHCFDEARAVVCRRPFGRYLRFRSLASRRRQGRHAEGQGCRLRGSCRSCAWH